MRKVCKPKSTNPNLFVGRNASLARLQYLERRVAELEKALGIAVKALQRHGIAGVQTAHVE